MSSTITGTVTSGVTLGSGTYTSPLTIAAGATIDLVFGTAVYGGSLGTVVDLGTLEAGDRFGTGIALAAGYVSVGTAGLVSGYREAVGLGAAGTVVNAGTIESVDASAGAGVALIAGGSVDNSGSASLITGFLGVYVAGGEGEVTNAGTIAAAADGAGIALKAGGSVDNAATTALIEGYSGIAASGDTATVTNAGTIEARGSGVGVDLMSGGTVIDTGKIIGTTAIYMGGAGNNLLELGPGYGLTGSIIAEGTGNQLALLSGASEGTISGLDSRFGNFATVAVEAGAHWALSGGNAIGPGMSLDNLGTVSGGVTLAAGGYLDNAAGATIAGAGTAVFSLGGTVAEAGEITGKTAIYLGGAGGNLLELAAGYAISGNVVAKGMGNGLELLSGAGLGTISGLGSKFTGFATIAVEAGANWTLSGSNTIGAGVTLEDLGTLSAEKLTNAGSIFGGPLTLAAGGHLGNTAAGAVENATGDPVYIGGAGVTIVNAGTIAATGTSGTGIGSDAGGYIDNNGGVIKGAGAGILIHGGAGTIGNAGTILGTTNNGVALYRGGSISNAASGLIQGLTAGVYVAGGAGTVTNSGTIEATTGDGVFLDDGGIVTNTGLIEGAIGVDIAGGAATVVDRGTIDSTGVAVGLASSSDVLIVFSRTAFNAAGVWGGGGTLEFGGTAPGAFGGLGTFFQSFGTIKVDPEAIWTLSGDASGSSFVNDGKVIVGNGQSLVFGALGEDRGRRGSIDLAGSGAAEFEAAVAAGQNLVFTGRRGFLTLDDPSSFAAAIKAFKKGDTIDIAGVTATAVRFSHGKLSIIDAGARMATLTFKGHYTTKEFAVVAMGSDTEITIGKPPTEMPVFVLADPGPRGGGAAGIEGFAPFGRNADAAVGIADAAPALLWTADPFHFWTIRG